MSIKVNYEQLRDGLEGKGVTLVAVSKTKPLEMLREAYDAGARDFGENKVQELVGKHEELPQDIRWHMIGHLQRNKVKYIAPFVHLIHSVDSLALLKEVNKRAANNERVINVLLQVHIAEEETKFGLTPDELKELIASEEFAAFANVKVVGLMGMATNTGDEEKVRTEFSALRKFFDEMKSKEQPGKFEMDELSMGMSGDWGIAVEEGSTMIRVGSSIFGARNYNI
ncbi:YggS family pyridoxal phosphate enzyme [Fulvitalea axinellae]|uniref:Pyridoxal phosphate homeostasis protein n=1 Tax=Fulvitalea axinellae TaxID=1182444 RepID=A0AAU9CDU8_9BACT|nr:YggS family pyridoxal phosphate enzyme [Fulvitalea axinellae]